jgi:hypothetical protein
MGEGHTLFANYNGLFIQAGEGQANTENIFVKIYGVSNANLIFGHNHSRNLENGQLAPTRNLLREYLYSDGLPAFNVDGTTPSATRSPLFVQKQMKQVITPFWITGTHVLPSLISGQVMWLTRAHGYLKHH